VRMEHRQKRFFAGPVYDDEAFDQALASRLPVPDPWIFPGERTAGSRTFGQSGHVGPADYGDDALALWRVREK